MKQILFFLTLGGALFLSACSKDDAPEPALNETVLLETDYTKDEGYLWIGREGEEVASEIVNDTYNLIYLGKSGVYFTTFASMIPDTAMHVALESSLRMNSTNLENHSLSSGGIVWGVDPSIPGKDFRFLINNEGEFNISGYPDGENFTSYQEWTSHEAVQSTDYNILRIELHNHQLQFFINGTEVFSMDAPNAGKLDHFGYLAFDESYLQSKYFKVSTFE